MERIGYKHVTPTQRRIRSITTSSKSPRPRRTQAERTEETKAALIEAAVTVLHQQGYNAATTAVIADEAGVSRGSIIYHFSTRAQLMSEVITFVYEKERHHYQELAREGVDLTRLEAWPSILWEVFSQPSGMAVIEVLQASRSDPELAALVIPTQKSVEQASVDAIMGWIPGDAAHTKATVRLFVWAIRGLALSSVLSPDKAETEDAVSIFQRLIERSRSGRSTSVA
nr:TetR/AcrR family transcriptional regulator [Alteripontixanthobacter muriae]